MIGAKKVTALVKLCRSAVDDGWTLPSAAASVVRELPPDTVQGLAAMYLVSEVKRIERDEALERERAAGFPSLKAGLAEHEPESKGYRPRPHRGTSQYKQWVRETEEGKKHEADWVAMCIEMARRSRGPMPPSRTTTRGGPCSRRTPAPI